MIDGVINTGNVLNDSRVFTDSLDVDKVQSVSNMFESNVDVNLTNETIFKIERS